MAKFYVLNFFKEIPPRFALDGYRQVVNALSWKVSNFQALTPQPQLDSLIIDKYISSSLPRATIEEVLWETEPVLRVIEERCESLVSSDSEDEFKWCILDKLITIKRLSSYVARDKSGRRLVTWGIWRLANIHQKFMIDDLLAEVSYPDEIYFHALEESPLGSPNKKSNFLLMSPFERISVLRNEGIPTDDVQNFIVHIRNRELKELLSVLRNLGIDVSDDGTIELTGEKEVVINLLLQATGVLWPYFGTIITYTDNFKLFRGQSAKLYVDVPNTITYQLLNNIRDISESSHDTATFYSATKTLVATVNKQLTMENNLPWFKFSLRQNKFMKKAYGLQVIIDWPKFVKFIEEFSKADNPIWEKYQYISACRLPALEMISRDISRGDFNPQRYYQIQDKVRAICQADVREIETKIAEIKKILFLLKKKPLEFSKRTELPLSTHSYLLEAIALVSSIGETSRRGLFPSAYREIRVLLEKLSWTLFGDYLSLRCYQHHGSLNMDICDYNYALLASKKWYEWANKNAKELLLNIRKAREQIETLRKKLKHNYPLPGKDKFWSLMMSSWTFPSFVLLFGKKMSNQEIPQSVPKYAVPYQILPYATKDFEILGEQLGISEPANFAADLIHELSPDTFIIPPYPTTDFVIGSVEKWFSTKGLNKKYGEYSAFVHSYPDTMIVFPFSSVLEVKIFAHEISTIKDIISDLVKSYLSLLRSVK